MVGKKSLIQRIFFKIKLNVKNIIIEDYKRFFSKDNIFQVKRNNILTLFYLPDRRDFIEQKIIVDSNFFESELLDYMGKLIKKESVFLDIGANIGNHTLYFANILNAKKIYSFEPQKHMFNILKKNIKINNLDKKVKLFNTALGASDSMGVMDIPKKRLLRLNYGCSTFIPKENGGTKVVKLDGIKIKEKINFIKLDAEGFEKDILIGARDTIKKNKPMIFIEIMERNMNFVEDYFKEEGYERVSYLGHSDYLYIHSSKRNIYPKQGNYIMSN